MILQNNACRAMHLNSQVILELRVCLIALDCELQGASKQILTHSKYLLSINMLRMNSDNSDRHTLYI